MKTSQLTLYYALYGSDDRRTTVLWCVNRDKIKTPAINRQKQEHTIGLMANAMKIENKIEERRNRRHTPKEKKSSDI